MLTRKTTLYKNLKTKRKSASILNKVIGKQQLKRNILIFLELYRKILLDLLLWTDYKNL